MLFDWARGPWGGLHPSIVLFLAALVAALVARVTRWVGGGGQAITPADLRRSITVVAVLSPHEPVAPYLALLDAAQWPVRVRLRLLKMVGPQEGRVAIDDDATRTRVRLVQRVGNFDRASERARLLRASAHDGAYTLVLAQPVRAAPGWDASLLQMCEDADGSVVLTAAPPRNAAVATTLVGTFLCAATSHAGQPVVGARPFHAPPRRPQPSVLASARVLFGPAALLARAAPADGVNAANEDVVLSQSVWMHGATLRAPQTSVLYALGDDVAGPTKTLRAAWAPPSGTARTAREWALYAGRRPDGSWRRHARLGLTRNATHEERYCKYGDALQMHGL